jgi:nucleoid-associated protein YgaU
VITIRQYNHDDTLDSYDGPAERNRKRNKGDDKKSKGGGKSGTRYTVRRGDTLSGIAQRELGDSKRWREIAKLNNIRDPRSIDPGDELRLPRD